jgi:hypothetical protein
MDIVTKIQKDVFKDYGKKYSYEIPKIINNCVANKTKTATKLILTKSQDFLKDYFTPESPNGLFLYHSVGSGKTLTGVAILKEFEKKNWNTLWITRTTLKEDLSKALDMLPLSKKLTVLSYKQFSNIGKKKGAIYRKLISRDPSLSDPLYRTVVIIDEVHKLYTKDLKAQEMHDIKLIQKMIHQSYETSKFPCKIVLMSATPITKNPLEVVNLFDLIIQDPKKRFLKNGEKTFLELYVEKDGKFKKDSLPIFRDNIDGLVSYIDVSKNPEKFAQLRLKEIKTKISSPDFTISKKNTCKKTYDLCRKQLGIDIADCRKELERCKSEVKENKKKYKDNAYQVKMLSEKCKITL